MITQDQVKDLGERLEALKGYLHLEEKRIQIINEEEKTAAPGFWDDPKKAEVILKKIRQIKYWVEGYEKAEAQFGELEISLEFFKEKQAARLGESDAIFLLETWEKAESLLKSLSPA